LFIQIYVLNIIISMPDISMCSNEQCELKYHCYRYTAEPSEFRQSYGDFEPNDDESCDYQMKQPCIYCKQLVGHSEECELLNLKLKE
jgi:hypothetical protein